MNNYILYIYDFKDIYSQGKVNIILKNSGPIGLAVLTFIGYQQLNRGTSKVYINSCPSSISNYI